MIILHIRVIHKQTVAFLSHMHLLFEFCKQYLFLWLVYKKNMLKLLAKA